MNTTITRIKSLVSRVIHLILTFIVLSSIITIAGYSVTYVLNSQISVIEPPIILEPLISTVTVGPNGTSGKTVIIAQQRQPVNLIRNGDFIDGYGAWLYGEYDDDGIAGGGNLRGYWINDAGYQTPGYVLRCCKHI